MAQHLKLNHHIIGLRTLTLDWQILLNSFSFNGKPIVEEWKTLHTLHVYSNHTNKTLKKTLDFAPHIKYQEYNSMFKLI